MPIELPVVIASIVAIMGVLGGKQVVTLIAGIFLLLFLLPGLAITGMPWWVWAVGVLLIVYIVTKKK